MRILFVTPAFPPFPGGGERYVRALASRLSQRGHSVTVLTSLAQTERDFWSPGPISREDSEVSDESLHVTRLPLQQFPGGRAALLAWRKAMVLLSTLPGDQSRRLMRMARHIPAIHGFETALARLPDAFDLVHSFNLSWEYPTVAGWRYARSRGLPFVVTPFAHLGARENDRVARNNTMDHQRSILINANAVLALTSVERDRLSALGVPAARLSVIGAGVEALPVRAGTAGAAADTLQRFAVRPPLVIFVGRVGYDKGAIHCAEAVRLLRRKRVEVTLALMGQVAPEFERYARRLSDQDRQSIRTLGIVSDAEKHALMDASEMLLLPSRTDSFGLALLEAWQHGKPVIGARAGGIPGVIDDGDNGLLVRFGDVDELAGAILLLLRDEPRRQCMGQHGREKVIAQYSWDAVCDRVLNVYRRVLDDARLG